MFGEENGVVEKAAFSNLQDRNILQLYVYVLFTSKIKFY